MSRSNNFSWPVAWQLRGAEHDHAETLLGAVAFMERGAMDEEFGF
jgi:hypothetical protein